ncbi:SPOR domain-containing protein [Parabacteroides sp. 52]|uniref:SPOR domain-containing protein n=1 Tax=unclassified Parabacteroides TaxID=2649774 RepID=UPI0013D2FD14|nr:MULTISPECIES: SPOR domain-containing protein [unclassified Parabacteroides]NDV54848.1 SPOR domain-containing protein [Parabacteroides sp. 52]
MKHLFCIILLFLPSFLFAQSELTNNSFVQEEKGMTIFDALEKAELGKGNVLVHQSDIIRSLVGARKQGVNVEEIDGEAFLKVKGFRTQVFSGNQRASKAEALEKEKEIKEVFPDVQTYVNYDAPFWRLRVGDFRTREEADLLLHQLRKAFPVYGKEMYIVPEEIKIPLY